MGDTYRFPVALKWDEGPDSLRKVRNKLLLHFQSKNKSNGGECQIRELDCSRGYIVIHFRDESVRDQVLRRTSHEVSLPDGRTLALDVRPVEAAGEASAKPGRDDLIRSPAAKMWRNDGSGRAEPPRSNLVLIENLQDALTSEMLTLLIEHISDRSDDSEFYLERIPEKRAAVITFTCDIDVSGFIQEFSRNHRVNKQKLTATALEETRSVRAEGLPPSTEEDLLIMYLESPKLGAGQVQEVVMLPEEEAALVTFQDERSVEFLVGKKHVFSKKTICVYRYFPTIGIALYGRDGPRVVRPQPVQRPISPYLLEFIWKDTSLKQSMERNMADKMCEILWPDPQSSDPVITLSFPTALSSHLRTMVKVARTWTDQVSNEFSRLISRYRVIDCKMAPSAWEDIREQVSTPAYHGVLIKADADAEKVFLAGAVRDVNRMEQTFRDLVKESSRKAERSSRVTTMTEAMSAALYHIIQNSGLEKKILADVPELKMEYDPSTHNLRLTGLRDEVLQAKCEILSAVQRLRSKSIPLSPHVRQFLMVAGPEEVSCVLFVRHNINALMEVEENAIKLSGCSQKDLSDAEEQISRELIHQRIPVEDKNVLRSPEWRSLQSHLESHNAETCTVMIQEFPPGAEGDVVVSGLSSHVQVTSQQVRDFVTSRTVVEKTVPVRSGVLLQFIEEERPQIWRKIQTMVKVVKTESSVSLSAPRPQVEEAAAQLASLLSALHCDSLRIDKPGAMKFCKNREEIHATTAKSKFNCVIVLEKTGESRALQRPQYEVTLQSGVTVAVYQGDLCRYNVDVIVNAANEDLQHSGGLARALLKAAGPQLQDDCDRIIRKEGKLSPGDSVITDAGKLPCKQVIHTVGPRWDSGAQMRCERLLRRAITTSLELAAESGHSSIALPAVSSGIFGFPLRECATNILDAIENYAEKTAAAIQQIHLVDTDLQTVHVFSQLLRAKFGDKKSSGAPVTSGAQTHVRAGRSEEQRSTVSKEEGATGTTEGLAIQLVQKKIEDATTDVIVNSVGSDMDLTKGNVSSAIYSRAGANLQQLVADETLGAPMPPGAVIATDGCNLGCRKVLHVVVPQWDKGRGASEQILRKIIQDCLKWTNQHRMKSLSIPALGTGNLGYPKVTAAALMLDVISQFNSKYKPQNLNKVEIVLHPKDKDTIQAYNNQLLDFGEGLSISKKPSSRSGSVFCGTVTNPSLGVHEMKIGPVSVQIKTGDITKEGAEVIVNSSNQNFSLHSGVSKAILDAAGPSVVSAARALGSQPHKGYVITDAGNLVESKWILHVSGPSQPADIKKIVLDCLQEAETHRASCVAFPALGTGAGGLAPAAVADAILDGVMDFVGLGSAKSIQTVKVVIFQQPMLNDFYTSLKKKEGSALPGSRSFLDRISAFLLPSVPSFLVPKIQKKPVQKLSAFQLLDNIEPVTFSLCSDDKEKVQKTKQWLQQQIEYEQSETTLTDECVSELEESEYQKILTLQRKFQVSVVYRPPDPSIRISGLTRDVLDVSNQIQKIVNRVKDRKSRERAAELTGNLVEWRYQCGPSMIPFHDMANLELEEANNAQKIQVTVQSRNGNITVDLKNLTATDQHGGQIIIERGLKHGDTSLKLPQHWQPMSNNLVMEVDVPSGSPEYSQVQQLFAQSCKNRILKIQRIQNKDLWLNYQIKKQSIDAKNGTTTNEKRLFHGTNINSIQHINQNGFNRSYAGRHGAAYGNGTYFAVNASYSAGGYAAPDANNHKHMYLARVLTGQFCAGQPGMVAPPAKNPSNTTDLYDSVTDRTAAPTMFIIFNDIQAYPEYHITFC